MPDQALPDDDVTRIQWGDANDDESIVTVGMLLAQIEELDRRTPVVITDFDGHMGMEVVRSVDDLEVVSRYVAGDKVVIRLFNPDRNDD